MTPSYVVYVFSIWCSASALIYGSSRDSVNLRASGKNAQGEPAAQEYYLLQRVGFESTGPAKQPRSPHTTGAECLTSGGPDTAGATSDSTISQGLALGWMPCQDLTTVESDTMLDHAVREQQLFVLNDDGTIMNKEGKCVRRVPCDEGKERRGYIYDLFSCDETDGKYVVKMRVQKVQANSIDHLRDMGYLRNAVEMDACELCGPYRIQNNCLNNLCGSSYQAKPGWTKLASQYVGDEAASGRSTYGLEGDASLGTAYVKEQLMNIDMSGLGYTKQPSGMCGSWVTDSPVIESYFYLLKDDTVVTLSPGSDENQRWQNNFHNGESQVQGVHVGEAFARNENEERMQPSSQDNIDFNDAKL